MPYLPLAPTEPLPLEQPLPQPAPAPPPEAAPQPLPASAPPPQQQAGFTVLGASRQPSAPPSQTQAQKLGDVFAQEQATQSTSAAPVSQPPAPAQAGFTVLGKGRELAEGTAGAVQEFTGTGDKTARRTYRPGDASVMGLGKEFYQAGETAADTGLQEAVEQGPGNILNIAGALKDVGASKMASNLGEFSPEGPGSRRAMVDANYYRLTHEGQWPEWAEQPQLVGPNGLPLMPSFRTNYENDPITTSIQTMSPEDQANFIRSYDEGFTDEEGQVYAPGTDAALAFFQEGRTGAQKLASDITTAPIGTLADIATGGTRTVGAKLVREAGEQAARGLGTQAGKKLAGRVIEGVGIAGETAVTGGLNLAVPAGFTALGKLYKATPLGKQSAKSADAELAQGVLEGGTSVLSQRRMAEGQEGVPSVVAPSHVTNPTADPNVVRLAMPAEGGSPAIDVAYHLNARGMADGVYDVVMPGPLDRYRRVTVADANQLYEAWGRLPNADRQKVRQAWFPELARLETSPGEPFIEQGAERLYDPAGNLIADTGRLGTGNQRIVDDLARVIQRDGRPDQIVTDYTARWEQTLYNGKVHPLTRRSQAEHNLQTLKDALGSLPASYRTPQVMRHIRDMEALLPKETAGMFSGALKWRGPISGRGGGLAPATPREASWLREMASLGTEAFRAKGLDAGRVGGRHNANVIFDRQPPASASPAFHNGYATYLDLMDFRLKNPPSARSELAGLAAEVNGLRTAAPTPAATARERAIADAVERAGIVPHASAMSTDQLVFAIEDFLRRNRPTFPNLPGAAPSPPAGIYPAGSQDELWGMSLDDRLRNALDTQIDIGGTSRTAGQRLRTHWEETATAHELAKRQVAGVPLSARDVRLLDKQVKAIGSRFPGEYKALTGARFAALTPEETDRISAALLKSDMEIAQGLRGATGKMLTPMERKGLTGKALGVYDRFIALWRSTVLYNVARGIGYPMMQAVGNLATLGLTAATRAERGGSTGISMYLNPAQWKRSLDYLKNPEVSGVPRAIHIRDRVGLGRTANLGRISRDQLGSRTAFNQEDSHGFTKAVGTVLGNQRIKDWADSWDQSLRHSLYAAMFEPSYRRLKRDLEPMAEQRFQRAGAAAGVPMPITRPQIDAAMQQLSADTGGYFSQPQLKQALYEAAGGSSAANRSTVLNAADRIARDYKEELRKLDEMAQSEVDRVAFAGTETNLGALMQRLFMFTWWVGNFSRLSLTEMAKSPIQMALWARALQSADVREQTGTNPRYKFFTDFMATPAGYTLSANPMGLLGGYLLGTSDDPTSERSVMTRLGEITEGTWIGENLILSPPLKGALFAIGALGQDARTPDIFGVNRIEREIVDMLNLVNHHLLGFAQTPGGNPERIPYPGVSSGVLNRVARAISGMLPGTQEVAGYDPNAAPESAISSYITPLVMRDNPELDPADEFDAEHIRHAVDLAMTDHDSALYQEGLGLYVDGLYQGPLTDKNTAALDILGGIARRFVIPLPTSVQPTERAERQRRSGRDVLRKEGSQTLSSEPERTELDLRMGSAGVQSPEGRDLALIRDEAAGDPLTQRVKGLADGLKFDSAIELQATFDELGMPGSITIYGYPFTPEQIASLPSDDRTTLQNAFLDDSGHRREMDAYYAARTEQLTSDKAFADASGWSEYAKQYPGGVDRAVDDTAAENPNFKAFIEGYVISGGQKVYLPELRVTDHDTWVAHVTRYEGAEVIAGVKGDRYGVDVDPRYAGVVEGLSEPVGTWYLREQEERAAGTDDDYTASIRENLDKFATLGQALDKLDAKYGQATGTYRSIFAQNVLSGALDNADDKSYALPYEIHNELKAAGVSDYFEGTTTLKNYLTWQLQQPAGTDSSVDAYQQSYWSHKNAERVPQIAQMLATGTVPPVDAEGTITAPYDPTSGLVMTDGAVGLGQRPGLSTIAGPTVLASEPGGAQGISVPAGMPVMTDGQKMQGSDGSLWLYVQAGGGIGGWVSAALLAPAA